MFMGIWAALERYAPVFPKNTMKIEARDSNSASSTNHLPGDNSAGDVILCMLKIYDKLLKILIYVS